MEIWESNKMALFVLFTVPGFICLKLYGLTFPSKKDATQQIIDLVAYSAINYAILSYPIFLFLQSEYSSNKFLVLAVLLLCVVVFPIVLYALTIYLRNAVWVKNTITHPEESAWNFVFAQRKEKWIVVTLKDGSKYGGWLGSSSFSTSDPSTRQIFIEKSWLLNSDGMFEREVEKTSGILILSDEISTVEFYELGLYV